MKQNTVLTATAVLAICLAISCKPRNNKVDNPANDRLYAYSEQSYSTSPEVSAWLQRVGIDSAERVLSRHNGHIDLGDTAMTFCFATRLLVMA